MDSFDPADLRIFVAIQCLGLVEALSAQAMDPADAARWLFHTEMLTQLKSAGACQGCLGLVELGAALSDGTAAEIEGALTSLRQHAMAVLSATYQ